MGQFRGLVFYLIFLGLFEWDFVNCKKRHGYFSNDIDVLDNDDDEDLLSVDNESARYPRVQQQDARNTWFRFVQRSHRSPNTKQKTKKNSRKLGVTFDDLRGERGPPGPPGPAGANVTTDVIMKLFRDLVREEAEIRTERLLAIRCPGCQGVRNETLGLLEAGELDLLPHVMAGFHQSLTDDILLKSRSFTELTGFIQPFTTGSFDRGNSFVSLDGRYIPPRTGVYNLVVNLHIRHHGYRGQAPRKLRRSEHVRVLICSQAQCKNQASLTYISGLDSNSSAFTINFSGLLFLQRDVYVSVFVENTSRRQIKVLAGSSFMGSLVGT